VFWVRDSIARRLLIDGGKEQEFGITQAAFLQTWPVYTGDKNLQDPYINWNTPIDWNSGAEDVREILRPMYLPEGERFYNRKEIDTRKLNYEYYRIDIRLAAAKSNRFKPSRSFDTSKDKKAKNKNKFSDKIENNEEEDNISIYSEEEVGKRRNNKLVKKDILMMTKTK